MMKERVIETNQGIQHETTIQQYDLFARQMRDRGWNGVDDMIATGVLGGDVLEIGPGPGYVGLEFWKKQSSKSLTGCEISPGMISLAQKNALEAGVAACYVQGSALNMPFDDESFDTVISNGSLHEWETPVLAFYEIHRVLRKGGRYCITDLRRNLHLFKVMAMYLSTRPKEIRPGMATSLHAAYTLSEIKELLRNSPLKEAKVKTTFWGLCIWGQKQG